MRVFVSGGAGFIGGHLTDRLISLGHSVCVYDNFSSGRMEHIERHLGRKGFRLIRSDLLDFRKLRTAMKGYDLVFHLASNPDIAKSMKQTDLDLKQGILATFNVLEAMRINGVKRIVFVSGSGIYGDAGSTYTAEDFGPLLPISMYGASKLSAEALISAFSHMFSMKAWIFRLANIIGGSQTHGVIYDFIRKLRENPKKLEILGDGKQSKSYLHVSDCLDAIFLCLKKAKSQVNMFNVATLDFINVREIAGIVSGEMNLRKVKYVYSGGKRGWKGDVPVVRLETGKIRKYGWKPKFGSREAVIRAARENLA